MERKKQGREKKINRKSEKNEQNFFFQKMNSGKAEANID